MEAVEGAIRIFRADFIALFLIVIFGGQLMVSSLDLVTVILSLELCCCSLCMLNLLINPNRFGREGAMKAFIVGCVGISFIVLGLSLIYPAVRSLDLRLIHTNLISEFFIGSFLRAGCLLIMLGFFLKMGSPLFTFGILIYMKQRLQVWLLLSVTF